MKQLSPFFKIVGILLAAGMSGLARIEAAAKPLPPKAAPSNQNSASGKKTEVKSTDALDTATVRRLYLDGDFEEAIKLLETALKEKRAYNHQDSVLIFKHLGVMYAANYETREKGKYYMHQLLMVEPTARIMDMYASDMIYMIFKNIQDEFESSRMKLDRAESHLAGNTQTQPTEKPVAREEEPPHGHKALYWVGASGAVVVAGAAAYLYIVNQPGKTVQEDHPVPE